MMKKKTSNILGTSFRVFPVGHKVKLSNKDLDLYLAIRYIAQRLPLGWKTVRTCSPSPTEYLRSFSSGRVQQKGFPKNIVYTKIIIIQI